MSEVNPESMDSAQACSDLGAALFKEGRLAEAKASFERALAIDPRFAKAHFWLANVLFEQNSHPEAIASYRRTLELEPNHAGAHNNLANLLNQEGRVREALPHYHRAAALKPGDAGVQCNLGVALVARGELDEAAAHFIKALALKPNFAAAHFRLATILARREHLEEAIAGTRRASGFDPNSAKILAQLVKLKAQVCDWHHAHEDFERLLSLMRRSPGEVPPSELLSQASTAADQFRCAREWSRKFNNLDPDRVRHPDPNAKRRLRLGYLCADYRSHPLAHMIVSMIECHDRSAFEVCAYSTGPNDGSDMRRRLEAAFDRFVDLSDIDDYDAAQRLGSDGIDILVDLTGYADYGRTRLLASRLAPVQVNGIGYTGTTGADFVDYIVADRFVVPFDQQPFFTERLVHLPDCYMPCDTKRGFASHIPTRHECGLPDKAFVFSCFNNRYKITPDFFGVWMGLLRAIPDSVLWLVESNSFVKDNLRRAALERGVDPDRLIFMFPVPLPEFLVRCRLADLFLDTLPYNAHSTANDALWAGLPVLTCAGATFAGRVAGSLLRAIGLPELVTTTLEEYEQSALQLARTPGLLAALRQRLAHNRSTTPLFDMSRYTRNIERAYRRMWETWCRGEAPAAFAVDGD